MTELQCEWLDDFLGRELSEQRQRAFTDHLGECDACRRAIEEWEAMRRLLQRATEQLELPDATLLERIDNRVAVVTSRDVRDVRLQWVAALVGACVLFAVITHHGPKRNHKVENEKNEIVAGTHVASSALLPPTNVALPDDVIGVPIDIGDPDVTVVWLYPTSPTQMAAQ
jgi:anti-sigma factor RsiW